jgi:hypothetical protein
MNEGSKRNENGNERLRIAERNDWTCSDEKSKTINIGWQQSWSATKEGQNKRAEISDVC